MNSIDLPVYMERTYRAESELGFGGSGIVYKAWHLRLHKYVVIKEDRYGSINDIEVRRNEIDALKNVKSAHLPQVFDFLTEGSSTFTVIEFVDGESFGKLLRRGQRFAQSQIVKWYKQLASALEVIHKQDICHRDIKPANIMLTPEGNVCLIDFNAALIGEKSPRFISRSPGYASPEQNHIFQWFENVCKERQKLRDPGAGMILSGDMRTELPECDSITACTGGTQWPPSGAKLVPHFSQTPVYGIDWKRSDIYSLGATMYHLLTGERPSERADEVIALSRFGEFSEDIVYVIERSMRRNPSERFASVEELAMAVRGL